MCAAGARPRPARPIIGRARVRDASPLLTCVRAQDYREAFNLFDKDKDGFISVDELQTVMRSVGHNPTNAEVRELINQVVARRARSSGGRTHVARLPAARSSGHAGPVHAARRQDRL